MAPARGVTVSSQIRSMDDASCRSSIRRSRSSEVASVVWIGLVAASPIAACALGGFLCWNVGSSRRRRGPVAYLGDSGSHALGMLLFAVPAAWPALLILSGAGGKDTAPSPTDDTTAASTATVTVVGDPNPAIAAPSANPAYDWSVGFVATLTNTETSARSKSPVA